MYLRGCWVYSLRQIVRLFVCMVATASQTQLPTRSGKNMLILHFIFAVCFPSLRRRVRELSLALLLVPAKIQLQPTNQRTVCFQEIKITRAGLGEIHQPSTINQQLQFYIPSTIDSSARPRLLEVASLPSESGCLLL